MKSTLFASTLAAALTATSSAQVTVEVLGDQGDPNNPWTVEWNGTTLDFYVEDTCSSALIHIDFWVTEETNVTYQAEVSALSGCSEPLVWSPHGGSSEFEKIATDFTGQSSWSGTFTLNPGYYEDMYFYNFRGTITFGCELGIDTDGDGVCDEFDECPTDPNKIEPGTCGCNALDTDSDGVYDCEDNCPEDPNKTEPGNCGCGVAETEVFGDLDCDGDYDIDDIRLGMTNFGIEEAEEDTCPADVDGNGEVGFPDLLEIISAWGPCSG